MLTVRLFNINLKVFLIFFYYKFILPKQRTVALQFQWIWTAKSIRCSWRVTPIWSRERRWVGECLLAVLPDLKKPLEVPPGITGISLRSYRCGGKWCACARVWLWKTQVLQTGHRFSGPECQKMHPKNLGSIIETVLTNWPPSNISRWLVWSDRMSGSSKMVSKLFYYAYCITKDPGILFYSFKVIYIPLPLIHAFWSIFKHF